MTPTHDPAKPVTMHPTTQDKRAITAFLKDGTWPRPGTMPVKFSFHR